MTLIDKDALVEKLASYAWNEKVSIDVLDMICGFPPAPIVHGRWIKAKGLTPCCSVCGGCIEPKYDYSFCPNCGAKMDGGARNEQQGLQI